MGGLEQAATLLSVRPGMTGLWLVSGRSSVSYRERIDLDLRYVAEIGLLTLLLLARTPLAVVSGRGAR